MLIVEEEKMLNLLQSLSDLQFAGCIGGIIVVAAWVQTQILTPRVF
jgi:hypothetical protein